MWERAIYEDVKTSFEMEDVELKADDDDESEEGKFSPSKSYHL